MSDNKVALIVGVGPGLGAALARRFSDAGLTVAVAARDLAALTSLASTIGPNVHAYRCDATDEAQVDQIFESVERDLGELDVVIHNAGAFSRKSILESTKEDVEACWRITALAGFFVGRAAARLMVERGHGTILFTGATGSIRGSALFQNSAIGKFGLRALAQSMARELQPKGVHVAHVIIDGAIDSERLRSILSDRSPDSFLQADEIAEAYYQLHLQRRGAWSQELDLRSWKETF
jgi:NAD(P)-dependent dehydrogenase (short-subunit alcohol dehydrogenase family)